ncbi:hypothetical protein ACUODJ_49155, partial [Escherichia sp. HC-CC]
SCSSSAARRRIPSRFIVNFVARAQGIALHVRAFLGLPVGGIRQYGPAASAVILPQLTSQNVTFDNVQNAVGADLQIRLFGKPEIDGSRRLGVALATAESVVDAIER